MSNEEDTKDQESVENREWIDSIRYVIKNRDKDKVKQLLDLLQNEAQKRNG